MEEKRDELLEQWMGCVRNGDVEGLLALYDDEAVLIPTFSNRMLSNPADIRAYFERLASRENLSIALHDRTVVTHQFDDHVYSICGIYCWRFEVDEEPLSFEARFTYVVDSARSKPIVHHHSSQIPRMI